MVKTFTCRDVGVDCDWSASSETEEGLMERARPKGCAGVVNV